MKRLVFGLAFLVAILLFSVTAVIAFELWSPPFRAGANALRCEIFNFASDTKDMEVTIEVLATNGTTIPAAIACAQSPSSGNTTACLATVFDGTGAACRFIVTGVGIKEKDVRASAQVIDPVTLAVHGALEAR
jgi:hypothetical protein